MKGKVMLSLGLCYPLGNKSSIFSWLRPKRLQYCTWALWDCNFNKDTEKKNG